MMIFRMNELTVVIHESVIDELSEYYVENSKEVGGILLGRLVNSTTYEVTEIECIRTRESTPISYQRDVKEAQRIINKRWSESDGEINYLGEWHTHPNISAAPSDIDIRSLCKIAEKVSGALPIVMLMIFGTNKKISLSIRKGNKNYACIFDR